MLNQVDIASVLFLDIETASTASEFTELEDNFQTLWAEKCSKLLQQPLGDLPVEVIEDTYKRRAAIYSEFGRIICISVGIVVRNRDKKLRLRLKSFAGQDEAKVLADFATMLHQYFPKPDKAYLCGHNIREFDIPYICRRMVVHQIELPAMLQLQGKKPWETKNVLDTLELWKFGDVKNYTSLKLLAAIMGIPSPKDDIDGSDVGRIFWEEKDLERIARYCEKDVLATVQLLLRFMYMPVLAQDQIVFVDEETS
jgi:hypothetical protein